MLKTPASFVALIVPQPHAAPHNFLFRGDDLLVREADLALPDADTLARLGPPAGPLLPVGLLDQRYVQASWLARDTAPPDGFAFRRMRALFGAMDEDLLAVAGRAFQIANWARTHRFCGACGTPTELAAGERCMRCPSCGHMAYPRISPAMMVLVRRGDHILLARHTASPAPFFTALAGFLEAGESIEEAIHREVMEEVGLRVNNLRYFGSQPWPFPHSLMVAFSAEYAGGEIAIDESEIAEARWFGPDDALPLIPGEFSIAGLLVRANLPKAMS